MNASTPNSLDTTTSKQSAHILSNATNDGTDCENRDSECKTYGTSNNFANRADDGHSDSIDEEIRSAYPESFRGCAAYVVHDCLSCDCQFEITN